MDSKIDRQALHQRWLHSYEEDTATERVYRPASYPFPPARGRMGFDLQPDQTLVDVGIAPTDGPRETAGTWELEEGDSPSLVLHPAGSAARNLPVVSVEPDRLVVRK